MEIIKVTILIKRNFEIKKRINNVEIIRSPNAVLSPVKKISTSVVINNIPI